MALSVSKVFRGIQTISFNDSVAPATRHSYSGVKADVAKVDLQQKEETYEIEDGQEFLDLGGWTGGVSLEISQLNATDLGTLQTYKPGATNGVDEIEFLFTALGDGTDTKLTLGNVTGLRLGLATGKTWKQTIYYKITGAADDELTDILTITWP